MAHIDISLGGKFKHAFGCCPSHDRFGKYPTKHGSKARAKGKRIAARMTRRIRKMRLPPEE